MEKAGEETPKKKKRSKPKNRLPKNKKVKFTDEAGLAYELEKKQAIFCAEYVVDLNGTQAAIRAGYSPHTAQVQASDLLTRPMVKKRVDELLKAKQAVRDLTADRIIQELMRIAFGDTRKIVKFESGKIQVTDSDKLSEDEAAMISEISQKSGNVSEKKVKFHSKEKALELLARHMGLLKDSDSRGFSGIVFVGQGEDISKV